MPSHRKPSPHRFTCPTEGDGKAAKNALFSDRDGAFFGHFFKPCGKSLSKELHPLVDILGEMKKDLWDAYANYERDFDGSRILDVVPNLIAHL